MRTEVASSDRHTPAVSHLEWAGVIGLLLVGAAFRLIALNAIPPGLHHDEVIIGQAAKDILRGHLAIYFTGGYGQEPLYHYVLAGFFALLGASAFTLRLTSAFIALLGLAMTYRFTRRLFSPVVAVGTLAWMSVSLWPIFFSRVGLRGITLPLLTTLTFYWLWKALHASRTTYFVVAGALLGLSIYTYQASRVFPVIFAVFFVYLAMTQRGARITHHAPRITLHSVLMFFITALLIAAPLIVYLTVINPSAEERVSDLSGPLTQLRNGDPNEVIHSTLNTLGMFTIKGDAVPIYNVSERPVFPEPIGAALFYTGLLVCLWRWKQPAYALMLIWFVVSLAPAMVTPFSPNFVRTMAAWPVPFVFAGLGMQSIGQLVNRLIGRLGNRSIGQSVVQPKHHLVIPSREARHLVTAIFGLVLAVNTILTYRDYFLDWPRGDYVRFWQQASWTQAVRTINADPSSTPVAASGLSIQDFDPQTFDLLGVRSDVPVEWFDCRNAVLFPNAARVRYLTPPFFECDHDLWSRFVPEARIVAQPRWPDTGGTIFTLEQFDLDRQQRAALTSSNGQAFFSGPETFDATRPDHDLAKLAAPIDLSGLRLQQSQLDRSEASAGDTLTVLTTWELTQSIAPPLKIFIHVTARDGKIVAQWDGLDVNISTLEAGDVFIQRHRLDLPTGLLPGPYRVSLGVYHPDSGQRLIAQLPDRTVDSIVLTMIGVK